MGDARYWFTRAAINSEVARACKEAGFTEAAKIFATASALYIANGLRALSRSIKSVEMEKTKPTKIR